jgi:hypothetical protein
MSNWKDEDVATPELMREYFQEFKEGIEKNPDFKLNEAEKLNVFRSLEAAEKFSQGLLQGKKTLFMHDTILMTIGFYGGYLTALDCLKSPTQGEKKEGQ